MVFRPSFIALFGLVGLLPLSGADAPPARFTGLLNNSPFGSGTSGTTAGTSNEPLEFRSVVEEQGNKFFSIYDTATRRSSWVELNDPVNGFSVKSFDGENDKITVDYQGRSLTLAIKRAPAVVSAAPVQPNQNVGNTGPMPIPMPSGNQPTISSGDQQRIQQIQEEIRRRRALRMQGGPQPVPLNGAQPGTVGQPSAGPQMMPPPSLPKS